MFWVYHSNKKHRSVRDKPYPWAVALVEANTVEDVIRILDFASDEARKELKPLAVLILGVLKERAFPKTPEAQFDFLADSLAGYGRVTARRSRDICAQDRATQRGKSRHRILQKEFYVECSCGYKGPARNNACRKCGAEIPLSFDNLFGPRIY